MAGLTEVSPVPENSGITDGSGNTENTGGSDTSNNSTPMTPNETEGSDFLTPLAGVLVENENFNIGLSRIDKEFYEE